MLFFKLKIIRMLQTHYKNGECFSEPVHKLCVIIRGNNNHSSMLAQIFNVNTQVRC